MKTLFYLFTLVPILYEMMMLRSAKDAIDFRERNENKKGKDMSQKYAVYLSFMFIYAVWDIVGIFFSGQWVLFTGLMLISMLPFRKNVVRQWLDSLISLALLSFILVNEYHLHLNLWHIITTGLNTSVFNK